MDNTLKSNIDWAKQTILLTGGTGSFGKHFCKLMLEKYHPRVIRIYSRDELKQFEMRQKFGERGLRYFIGDVRDVDRLRRAILVRVIFDYHSNNPTQKGPKSKACLA